MDTSHGLPPPLAAIWKAVDEKYTSYATLVPLLLSTLRITFLPEKEKNTRLFFFYLKWSAYLLAHDTITTEFDGTIATHFVSLIIPSLVLLAFDTLVPFASVHLKARGASHLPVQQLGWPKVGRIVLVVLFNVFLASALQTWIELFMTGVLHERTLLHLTSALPKSGQIWREVLKAMVIRSVLKYFIHRFVLHDFRTPLRKWHLEWQHSIPLPFSLAVAYDHPINYLIGVWLPTILPAWWYNYQLLIWYALLFTANVEDALYYSGYTPVPLNLFPNSPARGVDGHFESVQNGGRVGNFGNLGLLDLIFGSSVRSRDDSKNKSKSTKDPKGVTRSAGVKTASPISTPQHTQKQAITTERQPENDPDEGVDETDAPVTSATPSKSSKKRRRPKQK